MLQIRLLGQFDVRVDGKRATIPTRAAQSLLAYLVLTAGTAQRREKLAGMLWPEISDENARKNLRQELWRIRKAISAQPAAKPDYLIADELTLKFNREAEYWLDVAQMERPDLDLQSIIANLSLYQGELLPGFYDEWITLERERVQAVFDARMEQLLEQLMAAERWIAVQEWGERWLSLSGVRETAYRALMLASGVRGDMAKVSSLYQRCISELKENLGVEPSPETRALYNGLLKGTKIPSRTVAAQPSGTITFLFTDIESSTHLLEKMGDQYAVALSQHHEILRASIQKWNGREMDTQGDSFFVTFTRAIDAVQCAAEAQRALASHSWPQGENVRVRMGLHTGEPLISSTGYVGMDVHRAARLGDAGHGGQILLSQTTRELIMQDVPEEMAVRDLGEHRLKDMKYPAPIYQLIVDGLQPEFPPLRTKFTGSEAPTPGQAPFKGLQFFDVDDSDLFFGRETLTAKLLKRLREVNFLSVIIGASGSGKSSLVRAGVVPALKKGGKLINGTRPPEGSSSWQVYIITPTAHPLEALAIELTRDSESVTAAATLADDLSKDPRSLHFFLSRRAQIDNSSRALLVIDQFEELFTLCRDEFEREAFIDNLLAALMPASLPLGEALSGEANITLIITLRADFYAHIAQYPELRDAVAQQQEYIGPMTAEELRRAMEEPARRGHWEFEPGLVDLILRDVGDEPGALPLLSHALLETWKRRAGHMLTLKGYADAGGVHGAIAHTAESLYQTLPPNDQTITRSILLRLTEFGEGTEDTRRRASFSELMPPTGNSDERSEVRAVLNRLAEARLVMLAEDTAEVAHEALIREWPRLREWLSQDREGMLLHRRLTEAAQEWELLERSPDMLYRGARLFQAREWVFTHEADLNELERGFLNASIELTEREAAEREAQYQRELDNARKLAESERQRAEMESQRVAELSIINSVQEGLASKLEMQAIYDLVGDKIREIFHAQGTAIYLFDHETETAYLPYCFLKQRFPAGPSSFSPIAKLIILTAQPQIFRNNAEYRALGGKVLLNQEEYKSGMYVPLSVGKEIKGMVGVANLDNENAYDDSDLRLLATLANSMSVALENARLFDETERLLKETEQRAEEQARTSEKLRKRSFYLAGSFVIALIMAFTALFFSVQSNGNAMQAHTAEAQAEEQRDAALHAQATAKVEGLRAENEKQLAISRELAVSAVNNLDVDSERSILLALQALYAADTREAREALHQAVQTSRVEFTFPGESVAYSPDGRRLAIGGEGFVRVLDASTGQELLHFAGNDDGVNWWLTFSPDGKRLAIGDDSFHVTVWDASSGEKLSTLSGHTSYIGQIAFSPDGKRIATASQDHTARVWDAMTGQELLVISDHTNVVSGVAFSPDGQRLLTGSWDNTVKIRDAETGRVLLTPQGDAALRGIFSPDGKRFFTASSETGTYRMWDATTGQELFAIAPGQIDRFAFTTDGTRLVLGGEDGPLTIWDAVTGHELLIVPTPHIAEMSLNPDGIHVATAGHLVARVWNLSPEGSRELLTLVPHGGEWVRRVRYSPDGRRLATAGMDGTAKVFNAETGKELFTFSGHTDAIFGLEYSPDGTRIATASHDKSVKIWDASSGELLLTLNKAGHGDGAFGNLFPGILDVAWSADGWRLASAGADGTVVLWDATTGKELLTLPSNGNGVSSLAYSPDGTRLATTSEPGFGFGPIATLWDLRTGRKIFTTPDQWNLVFGLAFNLDGTRFATGAQDGVLRIWDAKTGQELLALPGHTTYITDIRYSTDGRTIATAGIDGIVKLWEAETGKEILTLTGHAAGVTGVSFSPDGSHLATSSQDGTVRVYLLRIEDLIALAKSRLTRSLTTEECIKYLHVEECPSR